MSEHKPVPSDKETITREAAVAIAKNVADKAVREARPSTYQRTVTMVNEKVISRTPRGVIRTFALIVGLFGLLLISGEVVEQVICKFDRQCGESIHLSPMLWGFSLLVFSMLVMQKGDVTVSLREFVTAARSVGVLFGRRSGDKDKEKPDETDQAP